MSQPTHQSLSRLSQLCFPVTSGCLHNPAVSPSVMWVIISLPVRTPTLWHRYNQSLASMSSPQIPSQPLRMQHLSSHSALGHGWTVFFSGLPAHPAPGPRQRGDVGPYQPNGVLKRGDVTSLASGAPSLPLCCWLKASQARAMEAGARKKAWVEAARRHPQSRTPCVETEARGCCGAATQVFHFWGWRKWMKVGSPCSLSEAGRLLNPDWAAGGPPLLVFSQLVLNQRNRLWLKLNNITDFCNEFNWSHLLISQVT